jgi:hypothetical protein
MGKLLFPEDPLRISFRLRDSIRAAIKPPSPARIDRPRAQHFHRVSAEGRRRGRGLWEKLREERQRARDTRGRGLGERERLHYHHAGAVFITLTFPNVARFIRCSPGGNLKVPSHECTPTERVRERARQARTRMHRIGDVIKFT